MIFLYFYDKIYDSFILSWIYGLTQFQKYIKILQAEVSIVLISSISEIILTVLLFLSKRIHLSYYDIFRTINNESIANFVNSHMDDAHVDTYIVERSLTS